MASSEPIYDTTVIDEDAPGPPISVPDSGDTGEGGKLKMILQLVKRSLGVKDLAAMFVYITKVVLLQTYLTLSLGASHYRLHCWNLSQISNIGIT